MAKKVHVNMLEHAVVNGLNDELRTKTEQDLFLFHVNIRSVINNEDDLIENISL